LARKKPAEIVIANLASAVTMLERCREFAYLMPEVRVNLVYALPGARTPEEVAAIDGRITVVNGLPHTSGSPKWGASDHMARLIIEIRKYNPEINAGINFSYDRAVHEIMQEYCREKGLRFGWIDRTQEPPEVAERDGSSMPWKVKQLVNSSGGVPSLFFEGDGWGKEPLSVALGTYATEVTEIAIDIARRYYHKQ